MPRGVAARSNVGVTVDTPLRTASRKAILVVDDDPGVVGFIADALDPARFAVQTAGTMPEARERLQLPPRPDLVVLDLVLPGGRKFDLLRHLKHTMRDTWPRLRVLVITGDPSEASERTAWALGADGFLRKPFTLRDLVGQVDSLLG